MQLRSPLWVAPVVLGFVFVASAAQARPADAPTVTLSSAAITAHWKESWLTGSVSFAGSASGGPVSLEAVLRPVSRTGPPTAVAEISLPAGGPFSRTLKLPSRMLPGTYRLTVNGTASGAATATVSRNLVNPAPAEGIVDRTYASLTETSPAINTAKAPRNRLWVHYHFAVKPKGPGLRVQWHSPNFRWYGIASKTNTTEIKSYVQSTGAPLMRGVWFAYLFWKGTVVKRTRVRIS
jgi:hypothetical protein